jgi:sugar lactone lactonase YvrE
MSQITINTVGSRISKWGEGPIYWSEHLYYVDIEGHALNKLDPQTGEECSWDMKERIGTVVPSLSDDLICAGDSGIYRFNPHSEKKFNLADPEADKRPENRFNDGKCDPAGRFWTGTISTVKKLGDANLYMLDTDGEISLKVPSVTNSNGICWNDALQIMYYIDTPSQKVMAYDYVRSRGEISNARVAIDFAGLEVQGSPDGMTIDSEGLLWVAMCHGGEVLCVNPENGKLIRKVELPCVETTACAFGGEYLDRLFVTTGIHKTLKEPNAGSVFVIDGLGVQGIPSYPYLGIE